MWSYLKCHWRGEHSLARSYWINGVLLGLPLNAIDVGLDQLFPPQIGLVPYLLLMTIYLAITIVWILWFAVGTWRSASFHVGSTGRRFWARTAQLVVTINMISVPIILYGGAILFWNLGLAALGMDGFTPATLKIDENEVLVVEGHIVFETPAALEQLLAQNEEITMVQLESEGGYIEPARIIAGIIGDRGLDTYVSIECSSACTQLFVAGVARYVDFDAVLGFHQAGLDGVPDSAVASLALEPRTLFLDQGVPESFLDKVGSVPSTEIWVPTLLELVEANVVTHVYEYEEDLAYEAAEFCAARDCASLPPDDFISEGALREPPG